MKKIQKPLITIGLLIILCFLPACILFRHYTAEDGFLGLIYFGQNFQSAALPEVKEIAPVTSSQWGYDGQFYSQLALRPTLSDEALVHALDNPPYRARRIGLPLLAFCLGLGKPAWILQIYALLNVVFWLVLLATLYRFVGFKCVRDWLLVFALLWTTGTLTSVERSLPDLPAAVLGVLALYSNNNWIMAASLLGVSGLVKETSILSYAAIPLKNGLSRVALKRLIVSALILFLPLALWLIYVHLRLPSGTEMGIGNFDLPFFGIMLKLWNDIHMLVNMGLSASMLDLAKLFSEILCPLSLIVQAVYLLLNPRYKSATWRYGIGFVILLALLGESVWVEQLAYCRALLPLTFSFNLLIHEHNYGYKYWVWYLLGNGGMCGMLIYAFI
ncbi:MAG: hypothetical protein JW908_16955 [Anaerolineales bacterium]|nr:hypothetical protein [Anaerolineales bacterium]